MEQQEDHKPGKIFAAIPAIMGKLEAIARERRNAAQGFNYRGIDDLYNALSPLMAEHKIFSAPTVLGETRTERTTKSGSVNYHVVLRIRYRFYAEDGSFFDTILVGEGQDTGDKASNKAESVAHKYALTQVFAVRTEDQKKDDPDATSPEESAKKKAATPPAQNTKAAPPASTKAKAESTPLNEQKKISQDQVKRLFSIARAANWPDDELRKLVEMRANVTSTKDIPWTLYEGICTFVEKNPYPKADKGK